MNIKVGLLGKLIYPKIWILLLLQGYKNNATREILTDKKMLKTLTSCTNVHFDDNMDIFI